MHLMADLETEPLLTSAHTASSEIQHQYHAVSKQDLDDGSSTQLPNTRRTIGWSSAFILVISRVIGSGIFAMPGVIVQSAGSPGLAVILWIAGAFIAWCSLVIDMEYGCMLPRSGGIKLYLELAYPWPRFLASTLVAFSAVFLGFTATNCIVFAKYILFAIEKPAEDFNTKLLAIALLTAITIVHGCFYRTGILIQNALGWLKLGLICFMILTGLAVVLSRADFKPSTIRYNDLFEDSKWDLNNIATSTFKIYYSYAGLSNVNNVMNEVKNPVRTLKTVGPAALLAACLMYILINVAYLAVVPLSEVKKTRELIAALFFERLFGNRFGSILLPISIALSAAGNVMVVTFSVARLNQEVARQGFLPFSGFLASSKPFNAPLGGLLVHFIPSALVIVLPPSSTVYAFIADVEGYAAQFFSLALALGLIILRVRKPDVLRPFKASLTSVWIRILLCITLIIAPIFSSRKNGADVSFLPAAYALVAISILSCGIIYWYIWTIALPHLNGYWLEEEIQVKEDGTVLSKLIRISRSEQI